MKKFPRKMTDRERKDFRDQLERMIEELPGKDFALGIMGLGAIAALKQGVPVKEIEVSMKEALAIAALKFQKKAEA